MDATLTSLERAFLAEPHVGTITTLRPDGSPHSTVVWLDVDDDGVFFNTAVGRAKDRYLRADPRLSLLVIDSASPYRWVAVDGTAELSLDGAVEQIEALAHKYTGRGFNHVRGQTRICVRIHATRVESYGLD